MTFGIFLVFHDFSRFSMTARTLYTAMHFWILCISNLKFEIHKTAYFAMMIHAGMICHREYAKTFQLCVTFDPVLWLFFEIAIFTFSTWFLDTYVICWSIMRHNSQNKILAIFFTLFLILINVQSHDLCWFVSQFLNIKYGH